MRYMSYILYSVYCIHYFLKGIECSDVADRRATVYSIFNLPSSTKYQYIV